MQRLWITGYRSYELNAFGDNDPKAEIIRKTISDNLIERLNNTTDRFWVITGPQMGTERWAIQSAVKLKPDYQQLSVAMMMPFAQFGSQWNEENQANLAKAKTDVDFADNVSNRPYTSPAQLRAYQGFMLTHTDGALMIYDPEYSGKPKWDYHACQNYAIRHDYPLQLVTMDDLQEVADEWGEKKREAEAERRGIDPA